MLTDPQLRVRELAVEAALMRLERRWGADPPPTAAAEVVTSLSGLLVDLATEDHAEAVAFLGEAGAETLTAAATPRLRRLAEAVVGALRRRAAAIVSAIRGRRSSMATIAATEVSAARASAAAALRAAAGDLGVEAKATWHAQPDVTHEPCAALDGRVVGPGEDFGVGGMGPPLHPNCRCYLSLDLAPSTVTAAADGPGWQAVAVIEGVETPDHRLWESGATSWRELPLPLTWAPDSDDHEEDRVVGSITEMWREGDEIRARGTWDTSEHATEAARLVSEQTLRWVSVVIDEPRAWELRQAPDGCLEDEDAGPGECTLTWVIQDADIAKLTIVDHPAIPGAVIVPGDAEIPPATERGRPAAIIACAALATDPPRAWFDDPQLGEPTPITWTDEGRIFGHFAPEVPHASGWGPPSSLGEVDLSRFHTRSLRTAEGDEIAVGLVVGGVGHPPRGVSLDEVRRVYDGPGGQVVARVRVGADASGHWMAGMIEPDLSEADRRRYRALGVSGDWRRLRGQPWTLHAIAAGILVDGYAIGRDRLVASGSPDTCTTLCYPANENVPVAAGT